MPVAKAGAAARYPWQDSADGSLAGWIARQRGISAGAMLAAISATHLVKERPFLGQTIRPVPGSVLASTAMGSWDPDPDYFFHWLRDSAIVMDALRQLIVDGTHAEEGLAHCRDFVAFSLRLNRLDGAGFLRLAGDFRKNIDPGFLKYVRDDSDLGNICGDSVLGEPRFNPDGTLDILKWSRPQHDGPALRALTLLRLWPLDALNSADRALMRPLILTDLDFVCRTWRAPCFDMWEEELGHHYSTRLLHRAALAAGALWLEEAGAGEACRAQEWRAAAQEIAASLDEYWDPAKGFYVSRRGVANGEGGKELDFAAILAVIHAGLEDGAHSVLDPKVLATLGRLETLFDASYEINKDRPQDRGPAMGRYAEDKYFSGGAYYFSTLGAAEFYYWLAASIAAGAKLPVTAENRDVLLRLGIEMDASGLTGEAECRCGEALLRQGDKFMAAVAAFTPASGELSEQFDQRTGAQTSAKTLAWSHAAFITAAARREAALSSLRLRIAHPGGPP
jgi:glucoamylase